MKMKEWRLVVGTQKRYGPDPTAELAHANAARLTTIDSAVAAISAHQTTIQLVECVYAGDGRYIGDAQEHGWHLDRTDGAHRFRRAMDTRGVDGRLLIRAGEDVEVIRERVFLVHGCESLTRNQRRRVADVIYAGIGAGIIEPAPTAEVEALAERWLATGDRRWLAFHGEGLRAHLGLPTGPWGESAWTAALRGRETCARLTNVRHARPDRSRP